MTTTSGIDIAAFLDAEHRPAFEQLPLRQLDPDDIEGTVATLRAAGAARVAATTVALPASVTVEDHRAPGWEGGPGVTVRLYRPPSDCSPAGAGMPAFYWIHGGGMVGGAVAGSDAYCAWIADELGVLVASVDYRLAPEHPYPVPLDDCHVGIRWLVDQAATLGVDRGRIALGGGSAGGGLAAGLALLLRDRGEIEVCYQHLVYPMLDDRNQTESARTILDSRVWNRTTNHVGWNAYLSGRAGAPDVEAYAAPARAVEAGTLAGLPPAYLCVGTMDLFLDEDITYARALLAAGVPAELHVYPGAFHGSTGAAPGAVLSKRWRADELDSLRRALLG